jgi:hypothetical protein
MDANLRDALNRLWLNVQSMPRLRGQTTARNLEQRYGLRLPQDFSAYVDEASPLFDQTDSGGITWWAPGRIRSLREECGPSTPDEQRNQRLEEEADSYLIFADYLDWCYAYAICCSDGPNRGKIALIGVEPDRLVASDFATFVDLAAADSDRLHSPGGDHYTDLA